MPIIPPTLAVPGPCHPAGAGPASGPVRLAPPTPVLPTALWPTSPGVLSLPLSFLASLGRPKAAYPFSQRGVFLSRPGPGGLRRRAAGGGPNPAAPRTLPWPAGICPPCLQTGKRRRGAEPSPNAEMTQPLFQHRLPFGLAPFQKPSPSTPFFPAFLLPPPPRLTVTLKQPPSPRLASPRRPKLLPQDRGMRVSSDRPFCPTPLPRIPGATGWQKSKLAPIYPSCLPLNTHKAHSFLQSWR
ncbi:uncharacterized protein LOC102067133 isoform X5 [Zonotrichia albicollis]|uniref:uncharacterized protein LOC102067133 isoform X5 n=1 Tax=Zonotrichia albicollis TaxID=44394 RepID=UPI003D80E0A0